MLLHRWKPFPVYQLPMVDSHIVSPSLWNCDLLLISQLNTVSHMTVYAFKPRQSHHGYHFLPFGARYNPRSITGIKVGFIMPSSMHKSKTWKHLFCRFNYISNNFYIQPYDMGHIKWVAFCIFDVLTLRLGSGPDVRIDSFGIISFKTTWNLRLRFESRENENYHFNISYFSNKFESIGWE